MKIRAEDVEIELRRMVHACPHGLEAWERQDTQEVYHHKHEWGFFRTTEIYEPCTERLL